MTHVPDGAPCGIYGANPACFLAAGWLSAGHPFRTGAAPEGFADRLEALIGQERAFATVDRLLQRCLGGFLCELCGEEASSSELMVPDAVAGRVWHAPQLIPHYVRAHGYLPPDGFVAAVLACPDLDDPAYQAQLVAIGGERLAGLYAASEEPDGEI